METEAITTKEQQKIKWLKERESGIGGSDIGTILGLNKHKTPLALWQEKTGRKTDIVDNNYTRAGTKLEPMVAEWFSENTGLTLINPGNNLTRHNIHDYILGTPDRVTLDSATKQNGILEIKTTGDIIDKTSPPMMWFCQVNWYSGIKKSYGARDCTVNYISWFERLTCQFDYLELDYDESFVQFMFDKAGEFWHKHVLADIPPEPMTTSDINALYSLHQPGKLIVATAELQEIIQNLATLVKNIKEMEQKEASLKYQVQLAMKDAEAVLVDGVPAITWKAAKDGLKFNAEKLKAEHPEVFEKYLQTVPGSRRFLIK